MKSKLARALWLLAVLLYLTALGLRLSSHRSLGLGDAIGPVALAIIGWSVFRRPRT